jgi:hypothetical protein
MIFKKIPAGWCLVYVIGIGICIMIITLTTLPYANYSNFDQETCHIINVSAPTQLPSYNNTFGWKECDCGKRCTAWTPCISLYASINPDFVIRNELFSPNKNTDCTLYNNDCPYGEDARYIVQTMEEVQTIMNLYLDQNITCYTNNDASSIYLHKSYKLSLPILFSIIAFILTMCGCIYCLTPNERTQTKKLSIENTIEMGIPPRD